MLNKRVLKQRLSLLNTDYVKLDDRWNYKNIVSPYHRIYYIDDGEGEISDTSQTLKLEPGYLYIIPSYTLCNLICKSYLSQYFVQFFEDSSDGTTIFGGVRRVSKIKACEVDIINFTRLVNINPGRGINRSYNPKIYEKHDYYDEYQELNNLQNMSNFVETQGILLQLISRFLAPDMLYADNGGAVPVKILDAMHFIMVNIHLPISVVSLAERANLNTTYFSRLFERHTGIRPQSYIIEKRIERAQHIMSTSQISLLEVAELVGFKSLSNFSRIFKKVTGYSPRHFKHPKKLNM
ncbi:AraC family transcriptional regulator [Mucilaginibacter puniceus]